MLLIELIPHPLPWCSHALLSSLGVVWNRGQIAVTWLLINHLKMSKKRSILGYFPAKMYTILRRIGMSDDWCVSCFTTVLRRDVSWFLSPEHIYGEIIPYRPLCHGKVLPEAESSKFNLNFLYWKSPPTWKKMWHFVFQMYFLFVLLM